MNKKIFTLLACALVLFLTAFNANARKVAQRSVGDYVRSVSVGMSPGMYHIQVDSVCIKFPLSWGGADAGKKVWVAVTYPSGPKPDGHYLRFIPGTPTNPAGHYQVFTYLTGSATDMPGDTIVIGADGAGRARLINSGNLQAQIASNPDLSFLDLQSTLWCTEVVKAAGLSGQTHIFNFKNKALDLSLNWRDRSNPTLNGPELGWMFSDVLTNLRRSWPLYQLNPGDNEITNGFYRYVAVNTNGLGTAAAHNTISGLLQSERVKIEEFGIYDYDRKDTIESMIKVSLVKASPYVLDARDFNTKLGLLKEEDEKTVQIDFSRNIDDNKLKEWLYAEDDDHSGYLNIRTYSKNTVKADDASFIGYLYNENRNGNRLISGQDHVATKYANSDGVGYLRIKNDKKALSANDAGANENMAYRFVYFPSEDSLVVNAYHAKHYEHRDYGSHPFTDNLSYANDDPGVYFNYGLYSDNIQNHLIVRYQDLNGANNADDMITIGRFPANVKMGLGRNCDETVDGWQVPAGVYTIWDDRGRCLGVRVYNGTYSPQWMELIPGECPDRIPSYQWVVTQKSNDKVRVDIFNREFGDIALNDGANIKLEDVLVTRESSQIFKHQSRFAYAPLIGGIPSNGFAPIIDGWVTGRIVDPISTTECKVTDISGFRPVTSQYLADPYLGYKHFRIDQNENISGTLNPSYGKSEDVADDYGMDYHAYAFRHLQDYNEDKGIALEPRYNDTLLRIEDKPVGFRFLPGREVATHAFAEEIYGYPKTQIGSRYIRDGAFSYQQTAVPVLKRYHYELKVADYYSFRNKLAEQFIVLKGAGNQKGTSDGDWRNELYYGVADVYAASDPFKYANLYLRETYFLPRVKEQGEYRSKYDDSRRIYYVLLDRIERAQLARVVEMGLEVSDTLRGEDGSTDFNLVTIGVNDNHTMYLKAIGKTVSSARPDAFSLSNLNYELYRRLRSLNDDVTLGEDEAKPTGLDLDAPKVLRIHRDANYQEFLHEDALSSISSGKGINFLGAANATLNPEQIALDGTVKYNYHLFIDTAYINRGTGPIKPQYLIGVNPEFFNGMELIVGNQEVNCSPSTIAKNLTPYTRARYLVNATDSSRLVGSTGEAYAPLRDDRYIMEPTYDRLVFVDAVHANDRLYIISELKKYLKHSEIFFTADGHDYFDAKVVDGLIETRRVPERRPQNSKMLGAYYDFGVWDNYHNDVSFSLRFVTPDAKNANDKGEDFVDNYTKRFLIESETTQRNPFGNAKIAPTQGGWIKLHNHVAVLSRNAYGDPIQDAEVFNVAKPTSWQDGVPTSNDNVAEVQVLGGTDEVTVLNAANKEVTVTNLLGQTVAKVVLSGNNQKIPVSKGVVVVNVEGLEAVKAVVK